MLNDLFPDDLAEALAERRQLETRELNALRHFLQDRFEEFQNHAAFYDHLEPQQSAALLEKITRHASP